MAGKHREDAQWHSRMASRLTEAVVEVTGVHGNAIFFNDYNRKVLQASYLAKRIMTEVEYNATIRSPLKDMVANETGKPFEDFPDFTYNLKIEALPHALDLMFKIFSGGMLGGDDKDKDSNEEGKGSGAAGMLEQMKSVIQQSVGDDPIWVASVQVSWPEGARRNQTDLAMVITDVKKLEDTVGKILDTAQAPASSADPNAKQDIVQPGGAGGPGGGGPPPTAPVTTQTTVPQR